MRHGPCVLPVYKVLRATIGIDYTETIATKVVTAKMPGTLAV